MKNDKCFTRKSTQITRTIIMNTLYFSYVIQHNIMGFVLNSCVPYYILCVLPATTQV